MAAYFSSAGMKFLTGLAKHNDREWFNARKDVYESELKAAMLAIVGEVNDGMAKFAPEFVRDPGKCMMRIYRDIRFSKNKDPYKTNVAAWWARAGMEKTSGAGFYFEFSPRGVTIAAGCYMPDKDQLLAIRRMLLERHEQVRKAFKVRGMEAFDGMRMTRAPKGFPAEHPANDLVLQRQWGIAAHLPAEEGLAPGLVKTIVARFKAAEPLVTLLNEPLVRRPAKPLF